MKKDNLKIIVLLFLMSSKLFAQVEYFVQVNPTTCSYTIIDSIPTIRWISVGSSTFDKINKRYVFQGQDNSINNYLCSIDAVSGNTVSIPLLTEHYGGLKFDNSTGTLYGIHWVSTLANGAEFVSINPANLSYNVIHSINLTGIGGDVTFDDIHHNYILVANDSVGNNRIFSIDVSTGNIISKPIFTGASGIQFDNSSENLYGLHWDNGSQTEYFVSVSLTTGVITLINPIPSVTSIGIGYSTFDQTNKLYTFEGDVSGSHLYTIDATTGQTVSSPPFPVFTNPYNLIETEYDNSTGNLYALHWGPYPQATEIKNYAQNKDNIYIYPNPASQQFIIETNTSDKQTIEIYDLNGRHLFSKTISDKANIDVTTLNEGIYNLVIRSANTVINKKLVIVR